MKIPLSWISLYTPLSSLLETHSIKELAHAYSIHTAEIDGIEEHFLDKVVVGKVLSCEKHPDSKKLSIVEVDLGTHGKETILTGAANISDATYVAVAVVGAVLPGDFTIGERMMAGMMSRGMICGADEIGISTEESTGIMILENDWSEDILEAMIGRSFFDLTLPFPGKEGQIYKLPLRDTTFEIDNKFITNRPDLFSVVGNAREFGAVFGLSSFIKELSRVTRDGGFLSEYKIPPTPLSKGGIQIHIETSKCLAYHLMNMEGITVGKSPFGIALMMERAGLAPKMDIVDITNLVMTELGQPMHAFDAEKITGDISVRMAKKGEKLLALNNIEYTLTEHDMVIADEVGPVALAGVIGGMASAVSESTTKIIWESACFDATSVRLTAQRHVIRTDASTRYEKSLDPLLASSTFSRVVEYMQFLGKNIEISGISHFLDESQVRDISIEVSYDFIDQKAGIPLPRESIAPILAKLGFDILTATKDSLTIKVPSWRATKDVSIKEDIAEEIIRVIGYENIPLVRLPIGQGIIEKNQAIALRDITLDHFRGEKWNEVYTYSFTSESLDEKILMKDMEDAIGIRNAYNEEYTHMRRSLAPRLFMALGENEKYSKEIGFFEIGKVYIKSEYQSRNDSMMQNIAIKPFPEKKMIAGVCIGQTIESLRKTLEGYLLRTLGYVPPVNAGSTLPFLHPGISGSYTLGSTHLIEFGEVHPEVATHFGLPKNTYYFQADFTQLLERFEEKEIRFQPISKYQTIPRELNFIMKKTTPTGEVARLISATHPWIEGISVSSVYEDATKIGEDKKSVNFSFLLSNLDSTISDDEALHVQNLIIEKLQIHGYELRSI